MDYSDLKRTVLTLFKDEWLNQNTSLLQLKLHDDEIEFYYRDSEKMMINFLYAFIKDNGFERPQPIIEKTLFSQRHHLLARIDKIENARSPPLVIDFKTSKSIELTETYKRQIGIGALLYEEVFKTKPTVGIHFLKFTDGLKKYRVSDTYLSELRRLVKEIHAKTESENMNEYPCVCGWCGKNFTFPEKKL